MRSHLLSAAAVLILGTAAVAAPKNFPDAPLRAVHFVDRNEGWAAGDDGAVWHSIDGGATWERQPTGVRSSLRAIHFVNPYTGWVVGRDERPNGGGSTGVILFTADGGLKWTRLAANVLPGLHAVRFFDADTGVVAGEGADAFGSGVFETIDGGKSWRPVPGPRQPGWLTADFTDPKTGAAAGAWGSLAVLRDQVFGKADIDTLGGRSILGLRVYGQHAAAVGQGGLILISRDSAGARWSYASPKCLSRDALANLDGHAVCVLGEHIWVAGRPGSVVLHSGDYGKTWESFATGQPLPLHAIHFTDPRTGWAVGELGTILGTEDGGKSWRVQRRGGHRAAALFVHAGPGTLPLEAVAHLADDGYLTAAVRVAAADPGSAAMRQAADPQRWAEAMRRVGGAAGECLWQFPLAAHQAGLPAKDLVAHWDKQHDGRAAEMLLRQLVLAIRMWQPEIVVTDPAGSDDALVDVAVREAFVRAADPKAFPEQIEQLGLKPWEVKKLYGLTADTQPNLPERVTVDGTRPLTRVGDTARDLAADAFTLLFDTQPTLPNLRVFHLRESRLADAGGHSHLMQGIVLGVGGTARRDLPALGEAEVAAIEERVKSGQARRNLEAVGKQDFAALGGPERVLARLGPALKALPVDQGAAAAFAVAGGYARAGQWEMAREAYLLMLDRYQSHPLALDAYRWLAQYSSSSEARRRYELSQFQVVTRADIRTTPGSGKQGDPVRQTGGTEIQTAQEVTPLTPADGARQWYQTALDMEPRLKAFGPLFARDPSIQVCLNAARRSLGNPDFAREWAARYSSEGAASLDPARPDPWREVAAAEAWLTNRAARPPRPVALCQQTPQRPYLDGVLDDACWTEAKALPLRSAAGDLSAEFATKAYLSYDADFLYVAVRCEHPAGMQVPKAAKRQRDDDLRKHDRVSILLDLDRDFQTCFHLQIDQRGCLAEDCWGDRTWNPKWYVAVSSDATSWTAEVAIPREELTGDRIALGKVWACNVVRVVPGRGVQAWSAPAGAEPRPEGMGLLIFGEERK